jgi:hypothetical protein
MFMMEEKPKKEGLFKRLFGGKKNGYCCCSVKIEEIFDIPPESEKKENDTENS